MSKKTKTSDSRESTLSDYPEVIQVSQNEKIEQLEKENIEMKDILKEYGIVYKGNNLSDTEYICLKQLENFRIISNQVPLSKDEVAMVDLLHKNLLMARNIPISKKSKKENKSVEELLDIVKNGK